MRLSRGARGKLKEEADADRLGCPLP